MLRLAPIIALAAALALAGCSTTTIAPPDRPRLDAPAPQLLVDCNLPANLPPGEMTQRDIERFWGADRKHLAECVRKHGMLRDFIVDRDGNLRKK